MKVLSKSKKEGSGGRPVMLLDLFDKFDGQTSPAAFPLVRKLINSKATDSLPRPRNTETVSDIYCMDSAAKLPSQPVIRQWAKHTNFVRRKGNRVISFSIFTITEQFCMVFSECGSQSCHIQFLWMMIMVMIARMTLNVQYFMI